MAKEWKHRETILKLLEKRDVSLTELKKKTSRQAIHYHLPILYKSGRIKPYIKGDGTGLKDEDIFYTLTKRYEHPQEIIELCNEMQSTDKIIRDRAKKKFINLCINRNLGQIHYARRKNGSKIIIAEYHDNQNAEWIKAKAKEYANILSAGLNPNNLKEKLAHVLTKPIDEIDELWDDGEKEKEVFY
ncbi:MAG: hypothetical protein L6282_09440 [Candidatus Methanoperedenaceae archaeon]|nr:hypothetical protein [Candidatus Methanoperedenaceae archaeon]